LKELTGQDFTKIGTYDVADLGKFSSGAEQEAFEIRTYLDNELDVTKKLFLEHDNTLEDGNRTKGYVVLDSMKRNGSSGKSRYMQWSVGNGHLSNDPNDEVKIQGHVHRTNRATVWYYPVNKIDNSTESLGQYQDFAYIENHKTGVVNIFQADPARR
jgi:hypothetical protein